MRTVKTCPRCGSTNISQAHNYEIRTLQHQYIIICNECGFSTEPCAGAGEAWEEWKKKRG